MMMMMTMMMIIFGKMLTASNVNECNNDDIQHQHQMVVEPMCGLREFWIVTIFSMVGGRKKKKTN